jgi:glycosyltransferase involved in cell wall biosynthesis
MKITFLVSGSINSNFTYRVLALADSMSKQGHDVSIIAPTADKYNNFAIEKIVSIKKIKIWQPFQFNTKRVEIDFFPYMFGAMYRVLKERPDIVYIYKPTPISIVGLVSKLFYKTQIILDIDDLGSEVMAIEGHPWHQQKLVKWCEDVSAFFADKIVAATNYIQNIYKVKFPEKPIYVMSNGVDLEWFSPTILSKETKRIVFMGAINRKNILEPLFDVLPSILEKHPTVELLIIGDGTYLNYFKDKCKKLNIESSVKFTGWLKIENARSYLCEGDIGYNYMPNSNTTRAVNNMKVPQYMSRGVVPIVSDIGDLASILDFGTAGYIAKADDTNDFKEVLLEALDDKNRLEKARRAREIALKEFNWDDLALNFYKWLVSNKKEGKQKIYFISTTVPNNVGGGEIRNYNLIKQLIEHVAADVEVFCISPRSVSVDSKKFESNIKAKCHIVPSAKRTLVIVAKAIMLLRIPPFMLNFKQSGIGNVFREACEKSLPDIVHIEQTHAYFCIRKHIPWLKSKGVKIVFDCHNIEYKSFRESLMIFSPIKRFVGYFLISRQKSIEVEALKISNIILACSKNDADFFKKYNPKTYVIPNGVDCSEFLPTYKETINTLIFMGGVGYPPNADAMKFYIENIESEIKKLIPDIKLLAIGTDKKWLDGFNAENNSIKPLGFVEDVRPYLKQASIGICPIRYGSGTRIKIMTCMASGLPVVSTTKGAEGVNYTDGENIIFADTSKDFSEAIFKLMSDKSLYEKIQKNGLNFIQKNFDWKVIGRELAFVYKNEIY